MQGTKRAARIAALGSSFGVGWPPLGDARDGRRARRSLGGVVLGFGLLFLLGALAVRPFAAEARDLLQEPRALRFFSCLDDHGSLGPGLVRGSVAWTPPGRAEVGNVLADRCPLGWACYYFEISDDDLAFKMGSVGETLATPPFVRLGEGAILGVPGEERAFLETFEGFDPTSYPIGSRAVKLVLLKAAAREWRHNQALGVHHGLTALALLPIDGFTSLCRLAVTPIIQSGGVEAAEALAGPWSLGPGLALILGAALLWVARPRHR